MEVARGLIVMVHGWAGDEKVMWIFARNFPADQWIVAPQGIYPTSEGGYGWTPERHGLDISIKEYLPAASELDDFIQLFERSIEKNALPITLVGFSQGTALIYTYGLLQPHKIRAIAGMSGFLPTGAEPYTQSQPLKGVPVWIAHGLRDETVPIERARRDAEILAQAGADIDLCESDVGHKLGKNCFHMLDEFIQRTSSNQTGA